LGALVSEVGDGVNDRRDFGSLYGMFVLGASMFENLRTDDIMRITASGVASVSSCVLLAGYTAIAQGFRCVFGESDRTLDLLVDASSPYDGALDSDLAGWVGALFVHGNAELVGCLVLAADSPPTDDELFLLNALAQPTGAALAAAILIEKQRVLTEKLRRLTEIQSETNDAMADTIRRLNAHQRVRDNLTRAATSGAGAVGLARALFTLTRKPVLVQDCFGSERAYIAPSSVSKAMVALGQVPESSGVDRFEGWRVSAVRSRNDRLGSLGVYDPDLTMSDADVFAAEYASTLLAVDLVNARNIAEVELRLGRDLVEDLISGVDPRGSSRRAHALHYDLNVPQRVLLLQWAEVGEPLEVVVHEVLARMKVTALVSRRPDSTVAIVAGPVDADRLHSDLTEATGRRGAIGVGGPGGRDHLSASFTEAQRALQVRARLHEPHGVTSHDELGIDRILDGSNGGIEIDRFIHQWLGPLLDHDRDRQSDLVPTLAAYLDAGGNYDATATALIIHRSTLRYRLARIRELCGRDFSDPDVRLNLHVAVRAWSVMEGLPPRRAGQSREPRTTVRQPD
jgi:hypothetical protein